MESQVRIGASIHRRGVGGALRRRPSLWAWLVAASTVVLAVPVAVMAVLWITTFQQRTATYAVSEAVSRIELDVGNGDVEILGGGPLRVAVRRQERFAYDHGPVERRTFLNGVLHIDSRCPRIVVGTCAADYRLTVPDNVPVLIVQRTGDVRMTSYRGDAEVTTSDGDILVDAFCGFALRATSESGRVRVSTVCSPERLELRTTSGDVTAVVPPGRYRVDADTTGGRVRVRGVVAVDDAPWHIQALSATGDVTVEATP
jgi:hypothetical protein